MAMSGCSVTSEPSASAAKSFVTSCGDLSQIHPLARYRPLTHRGRREQILDHFAECAGIGYEGGNLRSEFGVARTSARRARSWARVCSTVNGARNSWEASATNRRCNASACDKGPDRAASEHGDHCNGRENADEFGDSE